MDGVDLVALTTAANGIVEAADGLEALVGRIVSRTTNATKRIHEMLSGLVDWKALAANFVRECRQRQRFRSQWLDKQCAELDAVEDLLLSSARLCACPGVDLTAVFASVSLTLPLLASDPFPRLSSMVGFHHSTVIDCITALSSLVRLQRGVAEVRCDSDTSTAWCFPSPVPNPILLECLDKSGEEVNGILASDVDVESDDAAPVTIQDLSVSGHVITFRYTLPARLSTGNINLKVLLFKSLVASFQRQV